MLKADKVEVLESVAEVSKVVVDEVGMLLGLSVEEELALVRLLLDTAREDAALVAEGSAIEEDDGISTLVNLIAPSILSVENAGSATEFFR